MHRHELFGITRDIRQLVIRCREVGFRLREFIDFKNRRAGNDAAQCTIGNLQHLLNGADGADPAHVVRARIVRLFVVEDNEADLLPFAQRFLNERDPRLLYDSERDHGVGEEHRFLQRQNADDVRCLRTSRHLREGPSKRHADLGAMPSGDIVCICERNCDRENPVRVRRRGSVVIDR